MEDVEPLLRERPAEAHPGPARFVPAIQTVETAELPDAGYPFVLNTGRLLYHWHGGTITRRAEGLPVELHVTGVPR